MSRHDFCAVCGNLIMSEQKYRIIISREGRRVEHVEAKDCPELEKRDARS